MEWAERIVHYAVGGVVGILLAGFLAFGTGWMTMSRSVDARIEQATVEALASVCVHNSLVSWEHDGHTIDALAGDSNRDREALVERFIPIMDSAFGLEDAIRSACGNIIRARA
jgi:hypothetical protein